MGAQGEGEDVAIPTGTIVLVDTDVESSTALWEWDAAVMAASLIKHDDVMRSCLKAHVNSRGMATLKGVAQQMEITQCINTALQGRVDKYAEKRKAAEDAGVFASPMSPSSPMSPMSPVSKE